MKSGAFHILQRSLDNVTKPAIILFSDCEIAKKIEVDQNRLQY